MESNNKSKTKGGKNKNNSSPAHVNYKKKERTAMNRSTRRKEKEEIRQQDESFSVNSLISKFITNLFENNFSEADKNLKSVVESKITKKIQESCNNAKGEKLTKAENKKRFLEKIAKKKSKTKKEEKGETENNLEKKPKKGNK